MKPRKAIKRSSKRIRSRKADPAKRRFAKRRCRPYLDWLWEQPCQVSGLRDVEPAHIKPRSTGGDDLYNALSLSWLLHREQEGHTREFEEKYGVNLKNLARKQTEEFLELYPQYRTEAA